MKNYLLTLSALFFAGAVAFAQSEATDFTSVDCNDQEQNLFAQLDSGKVVVLVWVMPCGSCTGPAKTAYNVAKSYKDSHPGRVIYYLADDAGNTTCTSLTSWASNNSISPNSAFSDASISMSDYGSAGMPKVVVVGGPDHTVYFNKNNSSAGSSTGIKNAIDVALGGGTGIGETHDRVNNLTVYPNPAIDKMVVSYHTSSVSNVTIEVMNLLGEKVRSTVVENQPAGNHKHDIKTSDMSQGIYLVRVNGTIFKINVL